MTWQNAKIDAARIYAFMRERMEALRAAHGAPAKIKLARYPTAHDFRYLRPRDPWSWEYHTEVVRAVVRLASRDGIAIDLVDCTAAGCAAWCEERGLVPITKNRAAYVSFVQA
jgi:hypothetical protein